MALTLRNIVIASLGEHFQSLIDSGIIINSQLITKAVNSSTKEIEKTAVLNKLDGILEREVDWGLFIKVGEDQYKIGPDENEKPTFDGTTGELTPDPNDVNKQLIKINKQLTEVNKQLVDIKKQFSEIMPSSLFKLDFEKLSTSQLDYLQKKLDSIRKSKCLYFYYVRLRYFKKTCGSVVHIYFDKGV